MEDNTTLIDRAYRAFNTRDIDGVLILMQPDVQWPNGWEGGYVNGQEAVRAYWLRQWQEINPVVTPVALETRPNGQIAVSVQQLIKDLQGNVLVDEMIRHVYTFADGKISRMDIEKA